MAIQLPLSDLNENFLNPYQQQQFLGQTMFKYLFDQKQETPDKSSIIFIYGGSLSGKTTIFEILKVVYPEYGIVSKEEVLNVSINNHGLNVSLLDKLVNVSIGDQKSVDSKLYLMDDYTQTETQTSNLKTILEKKGNLVLVFAGSSFDPNQIGFDFVEIDPIVGFINLPFEFSSGDLVYPYQKKQKVFSKEEIQTMAKIFADNFVVKV